MIPTDPHSDARMTQLHRDLTNIRSELDDLYTYVYSLPSHERRKACKSLGKAIDIALRFARIDHDKMPVSPPRDIDGSLEIGPQLREHMMKTRELYTEIHDVRDRLTDFLDDADALMNASDRIIHIEKKS